MKGCKILKTNEAIFLVFGDGLTDGWWKNADN